MIEFLPAFVSRRLDPAQRYGLRLTLFVLAMSLVAIPFAFLLVQVSTESHVVILDRILSDRFFALKVRYPILPAVFNAISFLGFPPWFWLSIGGVSLFLFLKGRRRLVAFLLSTTLGGSLINTIVKEAVNRPRPSFRDPAAITFQTGKSFPSGHAMSSTIAYGALLLIFLPMVPKRFRPLAVFGTAALVFLIGISRLGLGVHYLSDVIGGWLLGTAWLAASTAAFSIWRVERGKSPVKPGEGLEPEAEPDLHASGLSAADNSASRNDPR